MKYQHNGTHNDDLLQKIKEELDALEKYPVIVNGRELKPSQCYHIDANPMHVLFNTNCPDSLRDRINSIISKHTGTDENSASE
jgi:hypothetical protein